MIYFLKYQQDNIISFTFVIDKEFNNMDFRLNVFHEVATHLSFTKASKSLLISQPAISKHIRELEQEYHVSLFERGGGHVSLTRAGELLLQHTVLIMNHYKQLSYEMNLLSGDFSGELRIGASTTIAQYLLPTILAQFIVKYPHIKLVVTNGNSTEIEQNVSENRLTLGIVEGKIHHNDLRYLPFMRDELVMITSLKSDYALLEEITLERLTQIPLVIRENGSGTLEVFEQALSEHGIVLSQLNVLMQLGSTEAIKRFLLQSNSIGVVSIRAIAQELMEGKFKVIDIQDFIPHRHFSFVYKQGEPGGIEKLFMDFVQILHL